MHPCVCACTRKIRAAIDPSHLPAPARARHLEYADMGVGDAPALVGRRHTPLPQRAPLRQLPHARCCILAYPRAPLCIHPACMRVRMNACICVRRKQTHTLPLCEVCTYYTYMPPRLELAIGCISLFVYACACAVPCMLVCVCVCVCVDGALYLLGEVQINYVDCLCHHIFSVCICVLTTFIPYYIQYMYWCVCVWYYDMVL